MSPDLSIIVLVVCFAPEPSDLRPTPLSSRTETPSIPDSDSGKFPNIHSQHRIQTPCKYRRHRSPSRYRPGGDCLLGTRRTGTTRSMGPFFGESSKSKGIRDGRGARLRQWSSRWSHAGHMACTGTVLSAACCPSGQRSASRTPRCYPSWHWARNQRRVERREGIGQRC
jgi:hypothetical protein